MEHAYASCGWISIPLQARNVRRSTRYAGIRPLWSLLARVAREQAIKDVMPKDERMLLPGPILKASPQPHDRTYQTLQHGRKVR